MHPQLWSVSRYKQFEYQHKNQNDYIRGKKYFFKWTDHSTVYVSHLQCLDKGIRNG